MTKTIMIVDDSASMRGLISMTLKNNGYEVIEASDGKEAIKRLSSAGKVDLIITDLNMPNMDGIQFIKTVKGDSKHRFIPVVMLTTESQDTKKEEGRLAGAKAWIVKPFKPEVLVGVVKKIIG